MKALIFVILLASLPSRTWADIDKDEKEIEKRAVLLFSKETTWNYPLTFGQEIPIHYKIYNTGNIEARGVHLEEQWESGFGEIRSGSLSAFFPVIAPGENVTHTLVFVPKPNDTLKEETIKFFRNTSFIEYVSDPEKPEDIHRVWSSNHASRSLGTQMLSERQLELSPTRKTQTWVLFTLWVTVLSAFPFYLFWKNQKRSLTVQEWYKKELGLHDHRIVRHRAFETTTAAVVQLPRFETHRELFHDDDRIPYQLGYEHPNPWVEKIFNKYAAKVPEPGTNALDIGRHKYTPKARPY
ncbi:unnamed protein product, partial [Mesorhabditis belari]|uniref:Uncharacterized protein n=1 Tax=Mesorhabditis belari TaxID=2138241 RepID=A0AAF3EY49_9BILA